MAPPRRATFEVQAYRQRLRILRLILADGNARELARQLDIAPKRWANYERGYPIARETAWKLWARWGVSIEWLWYGAKGNLDADWQRRIEAMEAVEAKHLLVRQEYEKVKAKMKTVEKDRARARQSLRGKRKVSAG